jgi:hypothetical protein
VLYLRGKYSGCRRCHRLTYASTQNSDRRVHRLLRSGFDPTTLLGGGLAALGLAARLVAAQRRRLDG